MPWTGRATAAALAALAAMAATAEPVSAGEDCPLAAAARDVAVEVRRFAIPGPHPAMDDVERTLLPPPCDRHPAPDLVFEEVDLGLAADDLRQGSRQLERRRLERGRE